MKISSGSNRTEPTSTTKNDPRCVAHPWQKIRPSSPKALLEHCKFKFEFRFESSKVESSSQLIWVNACGFRKSASCITARMFDIFLQNIDIVIITPFVKILNRLYSMFFAIVVMYHHTEPRPCCYRDIRY